MVVRVHEPACVMGAVAIAQIPCKQTCSNARKYTSMHDIPDSVGKAGKTWLLLSSLIETY